MEWWTSSSAAAAAAVVANDLGHSTGGSADPNAFFDPWLNVGCDELDLSIILSQHPQHVPTHLPTFCETNSTVNQSSPHKRAPSTTITNNSKTQSQSESTPKSKIDTNSSKQIDSQGSQNYPSYKAGAPLVAASSSSTTSSMSPASSSSNELLDRNQRECKGMQEELICYGLQQRTFINQLDGDCAQHNQKPLSLELNFPATNTSGSSARQFQSTATKSHIDHIFNYNSPTVSSQNPISKSIPSIDCNGRSLVSNKLHLQQPYQPCCSSVASPITSSSVSSSIADQMSPQNSVEISISGTPKHTCYPIGTNYPLNMLSPTSLINASRSSSDSDHHRSTGSLPIIHSVIEAEHRLDFNRDLKLNHSHNSYGQQYVESYCEGQGGGSLHKLDDNVGRDTFFGRDQSARCDTMIETCGCATVGGSRNGQDSIMECHQGRNNQVERLDSILPVDESKSLESNQDHMQTSSSLHLDLQTSLMGAKNDSQVQSTSSTTLLVSCSEKITSNAVRSVKGRNKWSDCGTSSQNDPEVRPTKASGGHKTSRLRRCRHITDYVLAEEEKRLLIKEGYTDFPMTSSPTRPLSRAEERILRKIRRKIRNKKSAQCSRQRKKEYVEELERKYTLVVRENEELKRLLNTSKVIHVE